MFELASTAPVAGSLDAVFLDPHPATTSVKQKARYAYWAIQHRIADCGIEPSAMWLLALSLGWRGYRRRPHLLDFLRHYASRPEAG